MFEKTKSVQSYCHERYRKKCFLHSNCTLHNVFVAILRKLQSIKTKHTYPASLQHRLLLVRSEISPPQPISSYSPSSSAINGIKWAPLPFSSFLLLLPLPTQNSRVGSEKREEKEYGTCVYIRRTGRVATQSDIYSFKRI